MNGRCNSHPIWGTAKIIFALPTALTAALVLTAAQPAAAQPGWVITDFGSLQEYAHAVVIQPDGKIVAGGYTDSGSPTYGDFALARYEGQSLEERARALARYIDAVELDRFTGPNANANRGRRKALSNRANAAADEIAAENYAEAIAILENLLKFVDGDEPPPDWIAPCDERNEIVSRVVGVIAALELLL